MKSAIYSPYLDTLGGGERYMFSIAEFLSQHGSVDIFWDDASIKRTAEDRFKLDLTNVNFVPNVFSKGVIQKWQALHSYDVLVYLSDGSFPYGFAKKNILHMQMPLDVPNAKSFNNKAKLRTWQVVVCNSKFTKQATDAMFGVKSTVLYPPVDVEAFQVAKKTKTILSVGRFLKEDHGKRQLLLVDQFKRLSQSNPDWRLVLVGSVENQAYYDEVTQAVKNLPIEVIGNAPFAKLVELYGEASIYWHAQGYQETNPQFMEHFGIVTVEAMASGCVPIVFDAGGQREIVTDKANGYLWQTTDELIDQTEKLISDPDLRQKLSDAAVLASKQFSKTVFTNELKKLLL